jgi:hypothetical protein
MPKLIYNVYAKRISQKLAICVYVQAILQRSVTNVFVPKHLFSEILIACALKTPKLMTINASAPKIS